MLTPVFLNGFSVESFVDRKFAPYVPTDGIAHSFAQGVFIPGRYGGFAWDIFNTAFWEINYTTPTFAPSSVVNVHLNIKPTYHSGDPLTQSWFRVMFLRLQFGNQNQIALQMNETGHIEVVRGGVGRNATGTVIATTSASFPVGQWADLELRVAVGAPGNVRLWREGVEVINVNTNTNAQGSTIDRVTLRWETFGPPGMAFCDFAVGIGDSNVDRFGVCRVMKISPIADYITGAWSTVNAWPNRPPGGVTHFGCVNDLLSDLDRGAPDDNTSYLAGDGSSGVDLFGVQETDCVGSILAVAANLAAKALTGSPRVQAIFQDSTEGTPRNVGAVVLPDSAGYPVQQRMIELYPVTGDRWGDADIISSAWGLLAGAGGTMRVTTFYLEKLVSLDPTVPYECGGGESYVI